MTPDDLQTINERLDTLSREMADVRADVRVIRTLLDSEGQRCPFREKISEASGLVPRVGKLEDRLVALEIRVAGIAALSGVVVSIITTLVLSAFRGGTP
jgi:hypothetical protein